MENGKRSKAIEVLQLPEPIIQHIQSFLSSKQAATMAILSKSWYNSWLTNPILDFDDRDFRNDNPLSGVNIPFLNFVEKRIDTYHESNLHIDSFKLRMNIGHFHASDLVTESILKAVKMGVHNLNIEFDRSSTVRYGFPKEVFESESLKMLSASRCSIGGISVENIKCSKLESLNLCRVHLGDETIGDIISKCPLIENITLYYCHGMLANVDMSKLVKLEKLSLVYEMPDMPESYEDEDEDEDAYVSVMGCPSNVSGFHKLSYLVLEAVKIDAMLFHDFSTKFPCIEDLTVRHCSGCMRFDISSHSLKYVTVGHKKKIEVKFDVPSILKFKFDGSEIPCFTFSRASNEWESDITVTCHRDNSWFGELNRFLTRLSGSRICLSFRLPVNRMARYLPDFNDLPKPSFENLTLEAHYLGISVCPALLDAVFGNLRPKFITQSLFPTLRNKPPGVRLRKANNKLLMLLCKKLMVLENNDGSSSSSSSSGTEICCNNLKEVYTEYFDDTFMKWRPLPLQTLLDEIMIPKKEIQVRFQLKWGPPDGAQSNHD